ncbi:MAG: hypothetical protein IT443_11495 [Phycisphaeraceae bacterium]|nr:hypothetical protein [Phycisphaeraceae bacterium]
MRRILTGLLIVAVSALWSVTAQASHSDHGCKNCHVPHKALAENEADGIWGVPLYSPAQITDGLPTFELYSSHTLTATVSQPDGPSKLCLGCHDGTYIAFSFIGHNRVFASDRAANGGMALKSSHPVSFVYDTALATEDGDLKDPATASANNGSGRTIAQDLLDSHSKMQCSSCHDVHASGIGEELLRWDISQGDQNMCRTCHSK